MKYEPKAILNVMLADKKKFSFMLALTCLGLLLWGRLLIKDVPRTAEADGLTTVVSASSGSNLKPQLSRPLIELSLPLAPARDPFAIDDQSYAKVQRQHPVESVQKLVTKQADEPDVKALVFKAAASLKLQSTMLGDMPRALISGEVVSPGQRIQGFLIKRISHRKAWLEKNGIEVVLEM